MNALSKTRDGFMSLFSPKRREEEGRDFRPRPCGEVDYDALAEEVMRKFPKILNRLAE